MQDLFQARFKENTNDERGSLFIHRIFMRNGQRFAKIHKETILNPEEMEDDVLDSIIEFYSEMTLDDFLKQYQRI